MNNFSYFEARQELPYTYPSDQTSQPKSNILDSQASNSVEIHSHCQKNMPEGLNFTPGNNIAATIQRSSADKIGPADVNPEDYRQLRQQHELLRQEVIMLREQASQWPARIKALTEQHQAELQKQTEAFQQQIAALKEQADDLNKQHEAELQKQAEAFQQQIVALKEQMNALGEHGKEAQAKSDEASDKINELQSRLDQNSQTSSLSPSSDLYKAYPNPEPSDQFQGGQPGHERHTRSSINLEEADKVERIEIKNPRDRVCSKRGGELVPDTDKDKVSEFYDLPELTALKTVIVLTGYICKKCGKIHYPDNANNVGMISHALLALLVLLKVSHHQSIRKTKKFFEEFFHLDLSTGYITKCFKRVTFALHPIYLELVENIKQFRILNIDETSHRLSGKKAYTWVIASTEMVIYKIATRSSYVLEVILGSDFKGTIACDCYVAYVKFAKESKFVELQICLAHLIREFKLCAVFPAVEVVEYARKNLDLLTQLFKVYHERKAVKDKNSDSYTLLTQKLVEIKHKILAISTAPPEKCKKAKNLAERMNILGESYFTFIENPDVEPSNNEAERMLRSIVIDRKITIGTESFMGNAFLETLWSIKATIERTGDISVFDFLTQAIQAYETKQPLPSLVNIGGFVDQKFIGMSDTELRGTMESDKKRTKDKKTEKIAKIKARKSDENSSETENKTKRKAADKEWDPFSHPSGHAGGSGSAEASNEPEQTTPPTAEAPADQSAAGKVSDGGGDGEKSPPLSPKEQASRQELLDGIRNAISNASKSNAPLRAPKLPSEACTGVQPVVTPPPSPKSVKGVRKNKVYNLEFFYLRGTIV
jgi:transposase